MQTEITKFKRIPVSASKLVDGEIYTIEVVSGMFTGQKCAAYYSEEGNFFETSNFSVTADFVNASKNIKV